MIFVAVARCPFVTLLERADLRVGAELDHPERHSSTWERMPVFSRADKRIHRIIRSLLRACRHKTERRQAERHQADLSCFEISHHTLLTIVVLTLIIARLIFSPAGKLSWYFGCAIRIYVREHFGDPATMKLTEQHAA